MTVFITWIVLAGIAFFALLVLTGWLIWAGDILRTLVAPLVACLTLEALLSTIGLAFVRPGGAVVSWFNAAGRFIEVVGVVMFAVNVLLYKAKVEGGGSTITRKLWKWIKRR